jgi:tetratricopeptide (TPR) repeat protein
MRSQYRTFDQSPDEFDSADAEALKLWTAGDRIGAINRLLGLINKAPRQRKPTPVVLQVACCFFRLGDYPAAVRMLDDHLMLKPRNGECLLNAALCYTRLGQSQAAIERARGVLAVTVNEPRALELLTFNLFRTGRYDAAADAGTRVLLEKDRAVGSADQWHLPAGMTAAEFSGTPGKRNVISYAVWGNQLKHLRGAARNLLLAPALYPGWQMRFYVDETVPADFIDLVADLGGITVPMTETDSRFGKLGQRFRVANDPGVGRFLVRDAHAVFSRREVLAVHTWIASNRWFHVVRDWWTHTDVVRPGLWGGIAGVLPDLAAEQAAFERDFGQENGHEPADLGGRFVQSRLWPYVKQSCLTLDRCFNMPGTVRIPGKLPEGVIYIGQDEFSVRKEAQEQLLAPWIEKYACLREQQVSE